MVLAVIHDGKIIYQRGYGMANLEHDVPLTPNSVFYIASTSKQFTAASVAMLARQGKISLDDEARKYIAELPDYGARLTIRHLVHHTSGLRDYGSVMALGGREDLGMTVDDAVTWIVRQKELNAPPGEEYSYTNSGYILMAAIVKKQTGRSLREFADEHIFRPLGMRHTGYRDDNTKVIKHRAVGHAAGAGGFRVNDPLTQAMGPGNLWTTVGDLQLWDQNFYDNKLGAGLVDELLKPGTLNSGQTLDYAFGLVVDRYKGLNRVHHGGAFAGFRTQLMRFPDQKFSVICLSNLANVDPDTLAQQVANLYLAGQFPPESASAEPTVVMPEAAALEAAAGTYRNPRDGSLFKFVARDGSLALEPAAAPPMPLAAASQSMFRGKESAAGLTFEFLPAEGNTPKRVRVSNEGGPPRTFEAVTIVVPTEEELQGYAGAYYSQEADATFTLVVSNGRLQLDSPKRPRQTLRPSIRDEFGANLGVMQFERNADGQVTAFRLNSPRVRKLRFERKLAS
jgi:CubicO group peptidase (beta-lactamase class C family)